MELFDLLAEVAEQIEREGIVYALTGSVAGSVYGRPRSSLDADIVLRLTPAQAEKLADQWKDRYYVSREGFRQAARSFSMTNLIHTEAGLKIVLSVLGLDAFSDAVLRRRRRVALPNDRTIWVVSAEDVILMKLVWRKDSRSTKQYDDALGVVQVVGAGLDWPYLRRWAERLDVMTDLEDLRAEGLDR